MHVEDLIEVERTLGYRYELAGDAEHYQWICPRCRRALLAIAQAKLWAGVRGGEPLGVELNPLPGSAAQMDS
jgi:hypothetical protein